MAINTDLLIILPFLGQFITDSQTTDPLLGEVYFYEPDKITLKNVYEQTGDPFNPFQVTPNPIQLNPAGGFVNASGNIFVPYLYPFDEADNVTEQLYEVEARRTDNSLAWAISNFPENFDGGELGDEGSLVNLCPTYGFDFPVFNDFYNAIDNQPVRMWNGVNVEGDSANIAQGWRWINNGFATADFFYNFEPLAVGTLPTVNPLFKLNLSQAAGGTPGTANLLGFNLTGGNQLEDKEFTYQLFLSDSTGTLGTLEVAVGVAGANILTPTTVGTIPITSSFIQQSITFTMPDVSGQIDSEDFNPQVLLLFKLPLSFPAGTIISFSGTFCSLGDTVIELDKIEPMSRGSNVSRAWWNNLQGRFYLPSLQPTTSGLPFSNSKGSIAPFSDVGNIWIGAANEEEMYGLQASSMPLNGQTIVTEQPLLSTITDRFLATSVAAAAGNSFDITPVTTTEFDIETRVQSVSYSTWTSSTASITIGTSSGSGIPYLNVTNQALNVLDVEFTDATLDPDKEETFYIKSTDAGNTLKRGTGYLTRNINNMVGLFSNGSTAITPIDYTTNVDTTIANTGTLPAEVQITFDGYSGAGQIQSSLQKLTGIYPPNIPINAVLYRNYFCFIIEDNNENVMIRPPPIVIQFHVDGNGIQIPSRTHTYTLNLDSSQINDGTYLATQLNNLISTSDTYTITVNSLPANGDFLLLSTGNASFIVVFYDTAFSKPANPVPSRPPIFVEFNSVTPTTTAELTTSLIDALSNDVGGIPTAGDLQLTPLADASILQYYTRV